VIQGESSAQDVEDEKKNKAQRVVQRRKKSLEKDLELTITIQPQNKTPHRKKMKKAPIKNTRKMT